MINEYLKNEREKRGLSQREFAKIVGLSNTYIANLERGYDKRSGKPISPTIETLKGIAQSLNIQLEDFLKQSGYVPKDDLPEHDDSNINPLTGKKMNKRERTQLEDVLENAQALFYDNDVSENDKEKFFRDITELFWKAKEMNRRKK